MEYGNWNCSVCSVAGEPGKNTFYIFWLCFDFELIPSNGTVIYPLYSSALVVIPTNEWINNCRGQRGSRADPINTGSDFVLTLAQLWWNFQRGRHVLISRPAEGLRRQRGEEREGRGKPWRPRWREKDVNWGTIFLFQPKPCGELRRYSILRVGRPGDVPELLFHCGRWEDECLCEIPGTKAVKSA